MIFCKSSQMSKITENDIVELINYMETIIQLIRWCPTMEPDYEKIKGICSSFIAERLRKKIPYDTSKELNPFELQANLQEHVKIVGIISPNIHFFDLPMDIDKGKYNTYLEKIFATTMTSDDRTCTRQSRRINITYKDIYDRKHQDTFFLSMLNACGNPFAEDGLGRNHFETVVDHLLRHLGLITIDRETELDYAGMKFYLAMDLLLQFASNMRTTADYIVHHYQIAYIWFRMITHFFNQTPREPSKAIAEKTKHKYMKTMDDLTGHMESFWGKCQGLKHLLDNKEISTIYDKYSSENHSALENQNNGLKDKVELIEGSLQQLESWQKRFEAKSSLIPSTADKEAGNLILLLLTLRLKWKNGSLAFIKIVNDASTSIVEKLKAVNHQINDEMGKVAKSNSFSNDSSSSSSTPKTPTHTRAVSFSS